MHLPPLLFRKFRGQAVHVREVGVPAVSIAERVRIVDALAAAGVAKVALSCAEAVLQEVARLPGIACSAVVTDMPGAERALACGADEISLLMSANEADNRASMNMTIDDAADALKEIVLAVRDTAAVNVCIAAAFGCREAVVPEEEVLELGDWFAHHGAAGITLWDSAGAANPARVEHLCDGLDERWRGVEVGLRFSDAWGMGLANVLAGMIAGIRRFDASLCAPGNVRTEGLVHMLEGMGCVTGIGLDALQLAGQQGDVARNHCSAV